MPLSLDLQLLLFFSKAIRKGEYVNLASAITLLWSEGSIFSPVKYSCLSALPDDKADILAASLLKSLCSFSSLILSPITIISFYIHSKRLFLKHKGLSDARVVSITKK